MTSSNGDYQQILLADDQRIKSLQITGPNDLAKRQPIMLESWTGAFAPLASPEALSETSSLASCGESIGGSYNEFPCVHGNSFKRLSSSLAYQKLVSRLDPIKQSPIGQLHSFTKVEFPGDRVDLKNEFKEGKVGGCGGDENRGTSNVGEDLKMDLTVDGNQNDLEKKGKKEDVGVVNKDNLEDGKKSGGRKVDEYDILGCGDGRLYKKKESVYDVISDPFKSGARFKMKGTNEFEASEKRALIEKTGVDNDEKKRKLMEGSSGSRLICLQSDSLYDFIIDPNISSKEGELLLPVTSSPPPPPPPLSSPFQKHSISHHLPLPPVPTSSFTSAKIVKESGSGFTDRILKELEEKYDSKNVDSETLYSKVLPKNERFQQQQEQQNNKLPQQQQPSPKLQSNTSSKQQLQHKTSPQQFQAEKGLFKMSKHDTYDEINLINSTSNSNITTSPESPKTPNPPFSNTTSNTPHPTSNTSNPTSRSPLPINISPHPTTKSPLPIKISPHPTTTTSPKLPTPQIKLPTPSHKPNLIYDLIDDVISKDHVSTNDDVTEELGQGIYDPIMGHYSMAGRGYPHGFATRVPMNK